MANYPAGWNDPPPLGFTNYTFNPGRRRLLSRRPPQIVDRKELTSEDLNPDVIERYFSSEYNSIDTSKEFAEESAKLTDEEILDFVTDTFEKILTENSERYEGKKIEEINQRITFMRESWDSKISLPVKQKMYALAKELEKGNAQDALKIQCALMVDHLREVKQWMVGVKHIIEMERQKHLSQS